MAKLETINAEDLQNRTYEPTHVLVTLSRHAHEADADTSLWWQVRRGYGARTC